MPPRYHRVVGAFFVLGYSRIIADSGSGKDYAIGRDELELHRGATEPEATNPEPGFSSCLFICGQGLSEEGMYPQITQINADTGSRKEYVAEGTNWSFVEVGTGPEAGIPLNPELSPLLVFSSVDICVICG
jgi:hypothetical protein